MPGPELHAPAGYYFALPRLLTKMQGGNANRSERSWIEANVVGLSVFGISYLFLARLLPASDAWWAHLLILAPRMFATFLFWLLVLYLNAVLLKLVRGCGFRGGGSDSRMQVVLVTVQTTIFALCLMRTGSWTRVVGVIWLIGVALNLIAAALLAASHAESPNR